ncbi:hypothetical protein HG530_004621 [Fusarium avenaceum]|nr:hypothetical protein HG530_004621 [Fusarium avenaceum]
MTTDIDDIVNATPDPVEALVVPGSTVSGEVVALVDIKNTLDVVAMNLFAANRVDESGFDTKEGQTYVNDVALLLANNFEVPLPDLGGDGLADRAKHSKMSKLASNMLVAGALQ